MTSETQATLGCDGHAFGGLRGAPSFRETEPLGFRAATERPASGHPDPAAVGAKRGAATLPLHPVAIDGLFGWFGPGTGRRGVVLCATLGYEQLSAHRPWRSLAGRIAATGCSVLSLDHPGTGDSGDEGADDVAAWIEAIRRAVRHLREEAGAEEIVLVGLRLGATLAVLAARDLAAEGEGIDRLVLLAPFATGRSYLREMTMQARSVARLPDGSPLPQEGEGLLVGGFLIGPALSADIRAIDLTAFEAAPAPEILLAGADPAGLGARFAAQGARMTALPFPGLGPLVANPLYAVAPEETFAAVIAHAAEGMAPGLAARGSHRPAPDSGSIAGAGWREAPALFGPSLFGILCRPDPGPARRPTVLFVNAGTNVHSGWGRRTTDLARALAREGSASLRMDLRGIGDSPDRPGSGSPLYSLDPLDDLRAALDHLEGLDLGPVVVVGACSGAYLAFQALCREPRLKGGLLVNPYCFDWNPQDDVDAVIRNVFRSASTYAGLLRRGDAWRRLLRREIRVGAIASALARGGRERLGRTLGRWLRPRPAGGTVARRVADLRRRGADLHLVYSAGDRGLAALHEALGRSFEGIARRLGEPVTIVAGADHDLSSAEAQARLTEAVRRLLDRTA